MVKEIADKKNLISKNTNREMDRDECAKFTQKTSLPLAGLLPKFEVTDVVLEGQGVYNDIVDVDKSEYP